MAERIGWIEGLRALFEEYLITAEERIGLVVDAYLNDLPALNARTQPVFANLFLPKNVTLIYASADSGSEYLPNVLIRAADRSASMALDYLEAGRAPFNDKQVHGCPFEGRRILVGKSATL